MTKKNSKNKKASKVPPKKKSPSIKDLNESLKLEKEKYVRLFAEFENYKIAQISDLHVGPTIKKPYVEKVFDTIANVNPDMLAVTGDLVDGSVENLRSELEPFKDMIAKDGTFFVTGNHEYYSGVDRWLDETDRLGMTNLINSNSIKLKILGTGEIKDKVNIEADLASKSAIEKLEKIGGSIQLKK